MVSRKIQLRTIPYVVLALVWVGVLLWAPRTARAVNSICSNVNISFSPNKATYRPSETVTIIVTGVTPANGTVLLHWTRATANSQLGGQVWTQIATNPWNPSTGRYEAQWVVTNALPGVSPYYNQSGNQEFIIAFTLYDNAANQFVCSGNPDVLLPSPGHPELPNALCSNCYKILVSRDEPTVPTTDLGRFWNVQPGYSFTYLGKRLDNPEDDNGNPLPASATNFVTRLEYEAPVTLCGVPLIPQRWTKNNRWGYWAPASAKKADRNTIWTDGRSNLRFFLTDPRYAYTWNRNLRGAYSQKLYEVVNNTFQLGYVSNVLRRAGIHTSLNHENYYYPPYFMSYDAAPNTGEGLFIRADSSYQITNNMDLQSAICQQRTKTEDHRWRVEVKFLTDSALKTEFSKIQSYFNEPKDMIVLTYFEGGPYSNGLPQIREDWYFMKDVGLVGIDQAMWKTTDTQALQTYFQADFMRQDTAAKPHLTMRADRAYVGQALKITPIYPGTSFPLIAPKGSCYTIKLESQTSLSPMLLMPYDGRLEYCLVGANGLCNPTFQPQLWSTFWADNGMVTACLASNFPSGEYKAVLRPYVTTSPSVDEPRLSYSYMPWSTNSLWVIVP